MSGIGSTIKHAAGGREGDPMHLKDSNCVSGRWLLVVRISCWAKTCSHWLTGASVCSPCFIVLLLAGSVPHQPSGHGEKYMILVLMNLLTNNLFSVGLSRLLPQAWNEYILSCQALGIISHHKQRVLFSYASLNNCQKTSVVTRDVPP